MYYIWVLQVQPADVGHAGFGRDRVYILMLHKWKGECHYNPEELYAIVASRIKASIRTRPRDYLVSTPRDIEVEAMRVAGLRDITFRPAPRFPFLAQN